MTTDLSQFVRDSLARGIPRERIRDTLGRAGWRDDEIAAAFAQWAEIDYPIPVPRRRPYLSAREAFLYLVLFATLYVVAFNAGAVLFALVEWRWPDVARFEAGRIEMARQVRFATAALVIAFPIFLFVSRVIGRGIARDPEKRGSRIRKWLTYLTLFIAALVLIGDLIALVSGLLSGELGLRFVAKVMIVFAIAGIVFGHYLGDLRREEGDKVAGGALGVLARVGAVATMIVIAIGLWFAGPPQIERRRQLDARRVEDLRALAEGIDTYARETRSLPLALDDVLRFRHAQVRSMNDPASGAPYEYRPFDSLHYELCAVFDLADTTSFADPGRADSRFWSHGRGHTCYALVVPQSPQRP